MQLDSSGTVSVMKTVTETYKGEGLRGFWKGALSPVMGMTPYNAMVFTVQESIKREMRLNNSKLDDKSKSFVAGSIAAAFATVIYCPIELLKVRAQVNRQEIVRYREAIP